MIRLVWNAGDQKAVIELKYGSFSQHDSLKTACAIMALFREV